ncbi:MAG TPA: aminopeptidase P N-terminal domain-containing protein [Isosphaeraceae bacterium]|jgi:Xaa-Pro aminopeptidase|nr:aminopeptidase P N-terminal domain-containing protein [Isosphaeraceae bacterium]
MRTRIAPILLVLLPTIAPPSPLRAQDAAAEAGLLLGQPRADYKSRRRALMDRIQGDDPRAVVVVRGEGPAGDAKYRQNNAFAYLTGVETPGACLILLPAEAAETLYLPPPPRGMFRAEIAPIAPGPEAARALGVEHVESTSRFLADLFRAIGDPMTAGRSRDGSTAVYLLEPAARGRGEAEDSRAARFARFLREGAPTARFKDLAPALAELRKAKSAGEVALLRKAIAITGDAQREAMSALRPGAFEYELEGKVIGTFVAGGALRPGFDSIIGSGPNATFPHYFANSRRVEDGELVVVDIGAEYRYYTADITRTYPSNGRFTPRQREVYQLVLDAQAKAAARVKPGETRMSDLNEFVRSYFRDSSLRAKGSDGKEQTMDHFFIHGLGHYLGMDVHDVGDYSRPLMAGEVITIEPGLYLSAEALGVRIEDDYLVTKDGVEKLSKDIPSDPDEIERRFERLTAPTPTGR